MAQTTGGAPLRAAFSRFATGVTIVTYEHDGAPRGLTVNSFTSVSMDPALALVSISKRSAAAGRLDDQFAVNVLSERQHRQALQFSGRQQEDVEIVWRRIADGPPELCDVAASFRCRTWKVVPAGDHDLYLAEIASFRIDNAVRPLLFVDGRFTTANQHMLLTS